MRAALFPLVFAAFAASPPDPLNGTTLETIHAQRVQWKIKRASLIESEGVYQDFRAVILASPMDPGQLAAAARDAEVNIVFGVAAGKPEFRNGVLFLDRPDFEGIEISPPEEAKLAGWQRDGTAVVVRYVDETDPYDSPSYDPPDGYRAVNDRESIKVL